MATAKLVIKKSFIKKDGRTPVYIQYIFHSEEKITITTGIEILPVHWNPDLQALKEKAGETYGLNYALINAQLSDKLNEFKFFLGNTIARNIKPTIKFVRDHFSQYLIQRNNTAKQVPDKLITIYDHLNDYIQQKKEAVANDTVKDYRSLIKHLKQFEKSIGEPITFESFDYLFYESFIDFLFYETVKPNGEKGLLANAVGKQIKNLKAFLRDRIRKKYCIDIDLSGYKTITEEVDKIHLTRKELSLVYHFNLNGAEHLEVTRDMLVLGCSLGLRFSDLSRITPEMISDSILSIRQKKVRKRVLIPIMNEAEEILRKYNWQSPSISLADFNKDLKTLGKLIGLDSHFEVANYKKGQEFIKRYKKYELLSSHVCRRSFCTNEYLDDTDCHLIMKISGHRTQKAFMTYLKIDEDVASRKIAEIWKSRKKL